MALAVEVAILGVSIGFFCGLLWYLFLGPGSSGWHRRRARGEVWGALHDLGFEVVPRQELGSSGPILTPKGKRQAELHAAARERPRGQG